MLNKNLINKEVDFVLSTLSHIFNMNKLSILGLEVDKVQKELISVTCPSIRITLTLEVYDFAMRSLKKGDVYSQRALKALSSCDVEETMYNLRCCKGILHYCDVSDKDEDEALY